MSLAQLPTSRNQETTDPRRARAGILRTFAQYVLNYTSIEAGYARASSHTSLDDLNGEAFRGRANFGNCDFIAGMTRFSVDNNPVIDHIRARFAGFGYHVPIASSTDLFAEATYSRYNPTDENGVGRRVGIRSRFDPRWEGSVAIGYAKINNVDSKTALDLQAQFFLSDKIGVVGGAAIGNNENTCTIELRYTP